MADALISPIISELTSIISSRVQEEYKLVVGVKEEIIKLKKDFTAIQAVLEDAERRQIKERGVEIWLDELKQVCYDMEDVLADWRIAIHEWEIKEADAKLRFFAGCCSPLNRCFNQVKPRLDIALKIKGVCERLDLIDKERSSYGFSVYSAPTEEHERPITFKSRVTTSHVDAPKMSGRDDDKKNLINKLLCTLEKGIREIPVVAIVGQGGIGKTTLAQLAYNDEQVKAHFEKRVWICVSEPFDKVNIARGIIRALDNSSTDVNSLELDLLLNKISELVNERRFLLVLDDVWNEDRAEWEQLKLSFKCGDPQSKILVTTRKKKVAEVMGTTNELLVDVGLLSNDDCWIVFKQHAFNEKSEDECKKLEDIGWKIVVEKVKGLPLAANILGGLMQFKKREREWEEVLSSNLWEVAGVERGLFGPLLLSYYDLPAAMRRCFTYCAMFPKDTTMRKSDMIRMWMAQGYLNKATSGKEMGLVGEEYFDNLMMRSFFQNLKESEEEEFFIDIEFKMHDIEFKMHDIVHDSAQILSGNECFSYTRKEIRTESCFNERVRHLSLLSPSREDLESLCSAKSLRSLYIEDHSETIVEALPKLLRNLKYLRALYLRSSSIKEIPSEVKELKHLRYRNLVSFRFSQNSTMDAIISPIISELTSIIRSWVKEEYKLVVGVKEELIKLKRDFSIIQIVLEDAERRQIKERGVEIWLDELKQVCYDMEDVLADWRVAIHEWEIKEADAKAAAADKSKLKCFNQVKPRLDIAHKIKDICKRLDQIDKKKSSYGFTVYSAPAEENERPIASKSKVTTSHVDASKMSGRDDDKKNLINKLLCTVEKSTREVPVVAIVGQGGIGKTTLAQLAYNDEEVKAHFQKRVWICVSEPFDKVNIARGIIRALDNSSTDVNSLELDLLLNKISELVNKKCFLLVLDDVWNEDHAEWEALKPSFERGDPQSRILVTTRKNKVAKVMGTTYELPIGLLSDDECWLVFKQLAFSGRSEDECNKLEDIGRKIVVEKVKGLPLAANILGGLMQFKKRKWEWEDVLSSSLWEVEGVESRLFGPLLLSYYDLPAAMRRCFTYCAMFPKDTTMRKSDMIRMWMAQGYLNKATSSKEMELVGEEYFDNFVMRSFFQNLEVCGELFIDIEFKMHDIVHDSAQILSGNECFSCTGKKIRTESCFNERVRHLSLLSPSREDLESVCSAKSLRSLYIEDDDSKTIVEALPKLLRNLKYLRALYLRSSSIKEIPSEVKELKHLRYFNLGKCRFIEVLVAETISKLWSLETLYLSCRNEASLVEIGIEKLINLRHLCISEDMFLPEGIGRLTSLRTLNVFRVGDETKGTAMLRELQDMDQLEGMLWIRGLGKVVDVDDAVQAHLKNKKRLTGLVLCFEGPEDELINNQYAVLEALEGPSELEYLRISQYEGDSFPYWLVRFPMDIMLGRVTSLRTLNVFRVGDETKGTTMLKVQYMNQLEGMLCISGLGKVVDVDEAVNANLKNKKRLTGLALAFNECGDDLINNQYAVLEELEGPSELEYLRISLYKGTLLPNWIFSLSNLTKLWLRDCGTLTVDLVALARLPSLEHLLLWRVNIREYNMGDEEEEEEEGGTASMVARFPKLKLLYLRYIKELEESVFAAAEMPQLREFVINNCPKMKNLPDCILTAPQLQELTILYCPILKEHYNKKSGKYRKKISRIPKVTIRE